MAAHNEIAELRRRGELANVVGLCRLQKPWPADATDDQIGRDLAAFAAFSGHNAQRRVLVSPTFRADVLIGSVAVLIRARPRPGSLRELLEEACSDHVLGGVVVLSAVAQHRRVPSRIGTVPIAHVPLLLTALNDPVEV